MINIEWASLAKQDYWNNIEFLEENWTEREVRRFIEKVNHSITLLQSNKVVFLKTEYKNVYKLVVIKEITLFYLVQKNKIILLRFWNNYQDLSNFKLK